MHHHRNHSQVRWYRPDSRRPMKFPDTVKGRRQEKKSSLVVNGDVQSQEVRVVKADDPALMGLYDLQAALEAAKQAGVDLIQVSKPGVTPAICHLTKQNSYLYELEKKDKKKNKKDPTMKTVQLRPGIDQHDLLIKLNRMIGFFRKGHTVKIQVQVKNKNQEPLKDALVRVVSEALKPIADVSVNQNKTMQCIERKKLRGEVYRLEDKVDMRELVARVLHVNNHKKEQDGPHVKEWRKPKRDKDAVRDDEEEPHGRGAKADSSSLTTR
jgi:translation initiation factor IF-3